MNGILDLRSYEQKRTKEQQLEILTREERPHRELGYGVDIMQGYDPPSLWARCRGCRERIVTLDWFEGAFVDFYDAVTKHRAEHMPKCAAYVDDLPAGVVLGQE